MNWFAQQARAFARAVRRLAGAPLSTLLSALVIGIALALPAGGQVLLSSFLGLARDVSGTPQISLFLALDASKADVAQIDARLKGHADLAGTSFVSREAALARLRESEGLADVLDSLPRNPFPDAFIATPKGEDPQLFERLQAEFEKLPKVEHVQLDSAWVKRLAALINIGHTAIWMLAVLLGTALVVVTFNTIRLQILMQKEEIGVSRLLGATDRYIRRPFYWFGALQGALGGLLAWGIVVASVALLRQPASQLAGAYGLDFALRGPQAAEVALLVLFAAILGWLGAALSVGRHLRTC
jgi:cell division transport system permease protein